MFDPTKLKAGDVVECLARPGNETFRCRVVKMGDPNARSPFCYVEILDQDGMPLSVSVSSKIGGSVFLDHIMGLVEDGPLVPNFRSDWDRYFMDVADQVATRATCNRKHVGAVIVANKTILSTGYNGSIRGMESCDERGHMMEGGHCVRTVHAEANAIVQAAKNGVRIDGADLYTTASPCWPCFSLLANAGIERVVFGELYRDRRIWAMATRAGITLQAKYPRGKCQECGKDPDDRHDHQ